MLDTLYSCLPPAYVAYLYAVLYVTRYRSWHPYVPCWSV